MPCCQEVKDLCPLKTKWQRVLAVISAFSLYFISGTPILIGNLSVYSNSYIKEYVDTERSPSGSWTLALYSVGYNIGAIALGFLNKKEIRPRVVIAASSLLVVLSILSNYFLVKKSEFAMTLTLGLIHGFATCVGAVTSLKQAVSYFSKRRALVSSLIFTAGTFNGVFVNQFISFYINPEDKQPDLITDDARYFTDKEILDRVPFVYIWLSVIYTPFFIVGLAFCIKKQEAQSNLTDHRSVSDQSYLQQEEYSLTSKGYSNHDYESTSQEIKTFNETNTDFNIGEFNVQHADNDFIQQEKLLTVREILNSREFWVCVASCSYLQMGTIIILRYYKILGQLWIGEDHFFTNLATLLALSLIPSRIIWGAMVDYFDLKLVQIMSISAVALSCGWLYIAAIVDRWLYSVVVFLCWNPVQSGLVVFVVAIPMKLFGIENFSTVYALLAALMGPFALSLPLLLLFFDIGLFELLTGVTVLGILSLCFIYVYMPNTNSIKS